VTDEEGTGLTEKGWSISRGSYVRVVRLAPEERCMTGWLRKGAGGWFASVEMQETRRTPQGMLQYQRASQLETGRWRPTLVQALYDAEEIMARWESTYRLGGGLEDREDS